MSSRSRWSALLAGKPRRPILVVALTLVLLAGSLTPLLFSRDIPTPQSTPAAQDEPAAPQVDLSTMLRKVIVGTVVVLVLSVATLWGCARWLKREPEPQGEQIHVLGRVMIDRRSHIFLVRASGHRLLAAVDASGLKALVPVSTADEEAEQ